MVTKSVGPPAQNETSVCSSENPDVVIVVGGKEYREYRQTLRCWSGYFDAAFRSGMKESKTNRFEFPDKDPKEWELVVSLLSPLSRDRVSGFNVDIVLPWFDELDCARGLQESDIVLESVAKLLVASSKESIDTLVDIATTSLRYNLGATKAMCFAKIEGVLGARPHLLELTHLERITSWIIDYVECQTELWGILQQFLPSALSCSEVDSLLQQDLFPYLVHSEIQRAHQIENLERVNSRLKKSESRLQSKLEKSNHQVATLREFHRFVRREARDNRTSEADLRTNLKTACDTYTA